MVKAVSLMMFVFPLGVSVAQAAGTLDGMGNDRSMLSTGDSQLDAGSVGIYGPNIEPKFGTASVEAVASWSSSCTPIRSEFTYSQNFGWRWAISGSSAWFDCSIQVPQGSILKAVGVEVLDDSASADVTMQIIKASFLATDYTDLSTVSTSGQSSTPQYLFNDISADNVTMDYRQNSYAVRIALSGDDTTRFRGVWAVYQRQVSPAPASATFNDVSSAHPFFQYIEALAASGITSGCDANNYCPDDPVTRGQMAVFLSRALGLHPWW
ncbi:S-layer homology domain-containing protein [Thiolapillus sp.]